MLRFGLKAMLIATAVLSVWLSTFTGFSGAADVRAFILTAIFVTSGAAAYYCTARRRAFWLGFFGCLVVVGTRGVFQGFGANFQWAQSLSRDWGLSLTSNNPARAQTILGINQTLIYGCIFIAATLIGLMCIYIHDRAQRPACDDPPADRNVSDRKASQTRPPIGS